MKTNEVIKGYFVCIIMLDIEKKKPYVDLEHHIRTKQLCILNGTSGGCVRTESYCQL